MQHVCINHGWRKGAGRETESKGEREGERVPLQVFRCKLKCRCDCLYGLITLALALAKLGN